MTHDSPFVCTTVQAETHERRFAACVCKKKRQCYFTNNTNSIEKTNTARKRKKEEKTDLHRLGPRRPDVPDVEAPVPVASAGHVPPARRNGGVHQAAEGLLLVLPLPLHPAGGVDQRRWLSRVHAARIDTVGGTNDRQQTAGDEGIRAFTGLSAPLPIRPCACC